MPNPDIPFGLTGGPDLHICNPDGVQDKIFKLDDNGNILLDGKRIGDALVPILSQVASASSSIDFTSAHVTNAYDVYLLVIEGLVVATDAKDLHLLVSNDGGSTFEADASEYQYVSLGRHSGGSTIQKNSNGATEIILNNSFSLSNVAAEGFSCSIYMYGAARAAAFTSFGGTVSYPDNSNRMTVSMLAAQHITAEVVNGLRIIPEAGNITSGRVTLYGVKHA